MSVPTNRPVFSGGDTFEVKIKFRATAARIYAGRFSSEFLSRSGNVDSMDTLIPGSMSIPAPSSSFLSPHSTSPGKWWGDFTLFHSASSKTLSISLSRLTHSVSPHTPVNMYSVPLNGFKDDTSWCEVGNDLDVVTLASWTASALARFSASARCDSALSAVPKALDAAVCALAASASACANSRCAAWAFASASLASARAPSAMPLTASASSCAVFADCAASPASLESSEARWSFASLMDVFFRADLRADVQLSSYANRH